jgi:hypothetical protein
MKSYTLDLTVEQLAIIDSALAEAPFKRAAPLIRNINEQIQKQEKTLSACFDENGVEISS